MHFSTLVIGEMSQLDDLQDEGYYDYWSVGGRWQGDLILKDGERVNETTFGEIDWVAVEGVAKAERDYKRLKKAFKDYWNDYGNGEFKERLNDLQTMEGKQETIFEEREWLYSITYNTIRTKKNYMKLHSGISYGAIVKDGQWWTWDDPSSVSAKKLVKELLSDIDNETDITIVDCHC